MDFWVSLPCSQELSNFLPFNRQINRVLLSHFSDLRNFLKPFSHVWLALPFRLIIQGFQPKNRLLSHTCYMPCSLRPPWFKGPNNICRGIKSTKLPFMRSSLILKQVVIRNNVMAIDTVHGCVSYTGLL